MRRHCGKAGCGCQTDVARRHRSLYLALSLEGKRRMLYIPPGLGDAGAAVDGALR